LAFFYGVLLNGVLLQSLSPEPKKEAVEKDALRRTP